MIILRLSEVNLVYKPAINTQSSALERSFKVATAHLLLQAEIFTAVVGRFKRSGMGFPANSDIAHHFGGLVAVQC